MIACTRESNVWRTGGKCFSQAIGLSSSDLCMTFVMSRHYRALCRQSFSVAERVLQDLQSGAVSGAVLCLQQQQQQLHDCERSWDEPILQSIM
ncbi:hypothetical protein PoB_003050200 [Plakobranchus ocellatus]|uniref:Uncharacterized protein n=1 Tax=Plakobranchus ocellatus TaxID=259542 RepID=A0AAV4A9X0_9GAST|nr:hypothetical protein PoB_003050200 [Plakobranchus ocellatus]